MRNLARINAAAHQDLRPHPHIHRVGQVDRRLHRFVEAIIERVLGYPDDLQPAVGARHNQCLIRVALQPRDLDGVADSASIGKVVPYERLVHHDHQRATVEFRLFPQPAALERNPQSGEIARIDQVDAGLLVLRRGLALEFKRLVPAAEGRRGIGRYARSTWERHSRVPEFPPT